MFKIENLSKFPKCKNFWDLLRIGEKSLKFQVNFCEFRKISKTLGKISEDLGIFLKFRKISEKLRVISEHSEKFLKIPENFWKLMKISEIQESLWKI